MLTLDPGELNDERQTLLLQDTLNACEQERFAALTDLNEAVDLNELDGPLVLEGDFVDYARQLAEDLGLVNFDAWPCRCIDWKQAAAELAHDYTLVTFEGDDYYVRT